MEARVQVVLITGCSSGIGAALCREFHQKGCKVIATARRIGSLEAFRGDGFDTEALDVNDRDAITRVVRNVLDKYGRIDMLVNTLLKDNPPPVIRLAKKSRLLPTLKTFMPVRMLDRLLMKKFGLATIKG
ncbi:MAG: SDR family NAD(P)-dependent oxidoreductase [Desulfobacterales bacterium]|jgi:NAD(P)-dependent dehydrogenase (short-subunit alcohol dehydrogenase family)